VPDRLRYLAYGSNMSSARIEARLGPCRCLGTASLLAHALRFHKRGRDGSGKCDAYFTGDDGDVVHGVLYEIGLGQAERLDGIEGSDYRRGTLTVRTGAGMLESYAYLALPSAIESALRPYPWYREFVLAGAREAGLPAAYVAAIDSVATIPDPDTMREAANARVLARLLDGGRPG